MILNDNHGMIAYFNKDGNKLTLSESNLTRIKSTVEFGNIFICRFALKISCPGGFIRSDGGNLVLKIFKLTIADLFSFVGVNIYEKCFKK